MRIVTVLITTMVCFGGVAVAQTPIPEIPDRAQCDSMAKKQGSLRERYPSRKFYLGCLVAGSVPTLLLESQAKTDAADKSFSKSTENIPIKDALAALRIAEAQANIGLYAAQYAKGYLHAGGYAKKNFPEKALGFYVPRSDYDFRATKLANAQMEIARQITLKIMVRQYTKLVVDEDNPHAELARIKSRTVTLKYCESMYKRYKIEKRDYAERSFLFPQSYQDIVFACAGVGINFYDLLFSARMDAKDKRIMQHMCEEHAERWKNVCVGVQSED